MILIGYSGHCYVVLDALLNNGLSLKGYCDKEEKSKNPFNLTYLGPESKELLRDTYWHVAIGDNIIRKKIIDQYKSLGRLISITHESSVISTSSSIEKGCFISAGAVINPCSAIGIGTIINTNATIEHECKLGNFVHIAPGATLAGNVSVGDNTFIGANAVVKQGIKIGTNVTVGAGAVIIKNIPDNATCVGNPGRIIKSIK